jgi:hypothetical protein
MLRVKREASLSELAGGCNCGKIRYSVKASPLATVVCHCDNCQKTSGAAFSVNFVVRKADIVFRCGPFGAAVGETA